MNDEEFLRYLDEYLEPPGDPNPEMAGLTILWVRDNPNFGARHIWEAYGVREE